MVKKININNVRKFIILLFVTFIFLAPLITYASSDKVDLEVYNKLENNDKVYVSVLLLTEQGAPSYRNLRRTTSERKEIFNQRKLFFQGEEEKVISKLTKAEFDLKNKFSTINGFSGSITKKGFDILVENPYVEEIIWPKSNLHATKILREFEENEWVPILVELNNNNVDNVVSTIPTSEIKLKDRLYLGNDFSADITKEGFNILIKNKNVKKVFLDLLLKLD